MARELGRPPSTIADEVARNHTVSRGPGKGGRVSGAPDGARPKPLSRPRYCNGCRCRRYHCGRPWRCEYSAARAQALAEAELLNSTELGVAEVAHAAGIESPSNFTQLFRRDHHCTPREYRARTQGRG